MFRLAVNPQALPKRNSMAENQNCPATFGGSLPKCAKKFMGNKKVHLWPHVR
jgi:hypothetical protein